MPNVLTHCEVGNGLGSCTRVFTSPVTAGIGRAVLPARLPGTPSPTAARAGAAGTGAAGAAGSAARIPIIPATATAAIPPTRDGLALRRIVRKMTLPRGRRDLTAMLHP